MTVNEAIILAGGKGTRISSVLQHVPKCMAVINDKPFLTYLLNYLEKQKITKVILSVGHLKDYIIENLQYSSPNLEIVFSIEDKALGTGGAIKHSLKKCTGEQTFVLNGDTWFTPELNNMFEQHQSSKADITIAVTPIEDAQRYGSVVFNNLNRITQFLEKQENLKNGYINGGIYLLNNNIINTIEADIFSIENDFFKTHISQNHLEAFVSTSPFLDIGIPEDYYRAGDFINKTLKI